MRVRVARKGKDIDLAGVKVQIDPFVLFRRMVMRQKTFLIGCAIVGGIFTIVSYLRSPKIFESNSRIAIRIDTQREDIVRKLVNRAFQDIHSDVELMLMINELDLARDLRANMPYELALKQMRRELEIDRENESIGVVFESKDRYEAQHVASFVTERVLERIASLMDAPHQKKVEALERSMRKLEPKFEAAQKELFEFKAKHPSIAVRTPDFLRPTSPLANIDTQLEKAETVLKRCFAGDIRGANENLRIPAGPACRALGQLKAKREELLLSFTPSHPSVIAATDKVAKQKGLCNQERAKTGSPVGTSARMTKGECIETAKTRIKNLQLQKINIEKKAIKKPALQQKWATLSFDLQQLQSELKSVRERLARTQGERLVAANNFQDNFQLVDPPRVPDLPTKPYKSRFMLMGMTITSILGLGISLLIESTRQTIYDAIEVEEQTGLPVFTELPSAGARDSL